MTQDLERLTARAAGPRGDLLDAMGMGLTLAAVASCEGAWSTLEDKHRALRRDLTKVNSALCSLESVEPFTEEEVARCRADITSVDQEYAGAQSVASHLSGRHDALNRDCPISSCPSCHADLDRHWRESANRARDAMIDARVARDRIAATRADHHQALTAAKDGLRKLALQMQVIEIETALHANETAVSAARVDAVSVGKAHGVANLRSKEIAEAEKHQTALDAIEIDMEIASAALQELSDAPEFAEVEEKIAALEAELEVIGRENERATLLSDSKEQIVAVEGRVEGLLGWSAKFKRIESDLLNASRHWLEKRLTATMGAPVRVELRDARGNDTCRLTVDGVDMSTLSGGERTGFLAAVIVAVASAAEDAPWRPLIVDGYESISKTNRAQFLKAVASSISEGTISQAIIAGCPDTEPGCVVMPKGVEFAMIVAGEEDHHRAAV